ncbi:phosphoglycolate phosphatase [Chromohalobacter canadensis]|uniref:Phosphoglycolate phosphatase n=1 Tax=Chromohalobacter canadensis TaxID=141389 RepID=A0A285VT76_9GAMM|nr:HAD-IA family hydrolase [Chromohalobacter canadensis]SOC57153.1 phosphoglycolate phosphatase [Chromohalobacter canadensis]
MSHARPAALLFDLDGTLVDTAPDLAQATNALRIHHGLAPLPYETIRAQVSNGGSALVELALGLTPAHADHGEARRFLLEAYGRDVAVHSRVFPGLAPLLEVWTQTRRPWGIVTNKPRAYAAPLVEALGLTQGVLVAADDLPLKKPDPAPLLEAARRLGVAPGDCWYIGDHLRDMQAARAAGMHAIAVRYGYIGDEEAPDTWPVDRWFETPESLTQALWPGEDETVGRPG